MIGSDIIKIYEAESIQEYRKWANEIPFINFKENWLVKNIPPYGGAIVRFNIKRKDSEKIVSVYLDCYDNLGSVGKPYWEVYPYKEDTYRCLLHETDKLLDAIDKSLGNKKINLTKI